MIRCKSELFQSAAKLVDCLRINSKEELKHTAEILSLSIPTKLRKEEYANFLAEAVLLYPEMWLSRLTHYELTLLDKLAKAGADTYIEAPNILMPTTLETLSFVLTDYRYLKEGKIRYMICDELREAVTPYLNNYLTSEKQATRFLIEQYTYGIINLYGLIPYQELLDLLNEYLQEAVTKEDIVDSLANSILIKQYTIEIVDQYKRMTCMQSPFVEDPDKLIKELYTKHDTTSRKKFTKEAVFSAGRMPLPSISNVHSDELKQYIMKKLGNTEEIAEYKLLFLWQATQTEENPMSIITSIIEDKCLSMQELQEAMGLFSNYLNHTPRWYLKGYSSEETPVLFKEDKLKNNPRHLVAGSNMKAADMDISPELQAKVADILFRETLSEGKVGRNDPCPCGSGKKYKKCCGRDR